MSCVICYRDEAQRHADGKVTHTACLVCGHCFQRLLGLTWNQLDDLINEFIYKGKTDKAKVVCKLAGRRVETYEQKTRQARPDTLRGSPLRMAKPALERKVEA